MNSKEDTDSSQLSSKHGFIKFNRSENSTELLKNPHAFTLLALISLRARWRKTINVNKLQPGEALLGDHSACGLTRAKYRAALSNLEEWKLITTRKSNRGTIAKLIDPSIFDINAQLDNQ